MSDEMLDYYKRYFKDHPEDGYMMGKIWDSSRVRFLKQFIEQYVPADGKILDIGCGDQFLAKELPQYKWQGIDINTTNAVNAPVVEQDLMKTPYPFPDAEFHAIVCSEVLEHVWDLRIIEQEMRRLIKPQGTLIISTPNYDNIDYIMANYRQLLFDPEWSHSFEHIRQYNLQSHRKFLEEAGFEVINYCGADAQMAGFYQEPRAILQSILKETFNIKLSPGQVDQILGMMFKKISPSIIVVARPK